MTAPRRKGTDGTGPGGTVPDGLLELGPGKIAAVATYLEMRGPVPPGPRAAAGPPAADDPPAAGGGRFESLSGALGRYRSLYAEVGEPWLWFSRAVLGDRELGAILSHPDVVPLAFVQDGRDTGLLELDFRRPGECELAFLGLVPSATGRGHGRVLVEEAVRRAFSRPVRRLWLHTCTLDHPGALPFYLRSGFTPYRRALEVADDPRLSGRMPRNAGPHFPLLPGA